MPAPAACALPSAPATRPFRFSPPRHVRRDKKKETRSSPSSGKPKKRVPRSRTSLRGCWQCATRNFATPRPVVGAVATAAAAIAPGLLLLLPLRVATLVRRLRRHACAPAVAPHKTLQGLAKVQSTLQSCRPRPRQQRLRLLQQHPGGGGGSDGDGLPRSTSMRASLNPGLSAR